MNGNDDVNRDACSSGGRPAKGLAHVLACGGSTPASSLQRVADSHGAGDSRGGWQSRALIVR